MTTTAVVLIASSCVERPPRFIWNSSASVPVGLYVLSPEMPRIGGMVAVHMPIHARQMAEDRRYLPANALLLKPIAAMPGDRVCYRQKRIFINGRVGATAAFHDTAQRLMPVWQGCRRLQASEIFVLSPQQNSFDSRYFGPIRRDAVVGVARPVVTF